MKHNPKITLILISMFLVTQLIGIYVVDYYLPDDKVLPFGLDTPKPETPSEYNFFLSQIIVAFIIAVFILFLLSNYFDFTMSFFVGLIVASSFVIYKKIII